MNAYLEKIKTTTNPFVLTDVAGYFISDSLKNQSINLYEAYLINGEVVRIRTAALMQPAWSERIRIKHCITILNQKLMAHVFGDPAAVGFMAESGKKMFSLNCEKRQHYIGDRYIQFMESLLQSQLLETLSEVRKKYNSLSDDDGPYHTESFPWDYCEPENILLGKQSFMQLEQVFSSPQAEDVFVALAQI